MNNIWTFKTWGEHQNVEWGTSHQGLGPHSVWDRSNRCYGRLDRPNRGQAPSVLLCVSCVIRTVDQWVLFYVFSHCWWVMIEMCMVECTVVTRLIPALDRLACRGRRVVRQCGWPIVEGGECVWCRPVVEGGECYVVLDYYLIYYIAMMFGMSLEIVP